MQPACRKHNVMAQPVARLLAILAACGGPLVGCASDGDPPQVFALASDSTGRKLVKVGTGIWTSTNGGITWIERAPFGLAHIQKWTSVASDSTGTNLVAVVNGFQHLDRGDPAAFSGDVWTSTDSGATWTDKTASSSAHGHAWRSVASDASGTKLVAVTAGLGVFGPGAIWTSIDAGVTWTKATAGTGNEGWTSVASDATGQNLVAVGSGFGIWASIDGGLTWTERTPADPKFEAAYGQAQGWSSVASDATGTRLVAAVDGGDIWTSTNGGVTWRDTGPATTSQVWFSVASDSTGTNLVAVDALVNDQNGDVWTSADGGLTWTDQATTNPAASGPWMAVASSAAGDHLVAVGQGAIWIH